MKFLEVERYTYLEEKYKNYIEELKDFVKKSEYLPKYHIYPPCGLLNDPNGLSYFGGQYHVFYQWFPFGPSHGMKHWGHVTSSDMVNWQWSEKMLIPNKEYEKNGCYSGNALVKDDTLYLFYTANYKTEHGKIPKQAMAMMDKDGHIRKYEHNPIIDGAPEGMSGEIRDPFVLEKDGKYYMLLGAKDKEGKGQLLLYVSEDIFHWSYQGIIRIDFENLGTMVECPSYMQIDGKDVLVISPMGFPREKERFQNEFPSLYLVGTLDLEAMCFQTEHWDEIDGGFDFYAPQMFRGKDGEPLMFGWFGCGEQSLPTDEEMWRHGLTFPRRLRVENGALYAEPIPEIGAAFGAAISIKEEADHTPAGKTYLAEAVVTKEQGTQEIIFGEDEDCWKLMVDPEEGKVTLDRSRLAIPVDTPHGFVRSCRVKAGEEIKLQIYVDNSFAEIYMNHGEKVMSARIFIKKHRIRRKSS